MSQERAIPHDPQQKARKSRRKREAMAAERGQVPLDSKMAYDEHWQQSMGTYYRVLA